MDTVGIWAASLTSLLMMLMLMLGVTSVVTPGGEQEILCLSEQGLYFFLGRSDKPAAFPFQKWLAGDVIPSIRRHGMYATPQTVGR